MLTLTLSYLSSNVWGNCLSLNISIFDHFLPLILWFKLLLPPYSFHSQHNQNDPATMSLSSENPPVRVSYLIQDKSQSLYYTTYKSLHDIPPSTPSPIPLKSYFSLHHTTLTPPQLLHWPLCSLHPMTPISLFLQTFIGNILPTSYQLPHLLQVPTHISLTNVIREAFLYYLL